MYYRGGGNNKWIYVGSWNSISLAESDKLVSVTL